MIKNIKNFNADIYDQFIKADFNSGNNIKTDFNNVNDYYISRIFEQTVNDLNSCPVYQSEVISLFDSVGYRLLTGYKANKSDNVLSNGISVSEQYLENKYSELDNTLCFYLYDEHYNEYVILTDKKSISVVENSPFCINSITKEMTPITITSGDEEFSTTINRKPIKYTMLSINPSFKFIEDVYYCKTGLNSLDAATTGC